MASNTAVASNAAVSSGLAAKLEPLLTTATPTPQTAAVRPLGVSTSKFIGKYTYGSFSLKLLSLI